MRPDSVSRLAALVANRQRGTYNPSMADDKTLAGKTALLSRLLFFKQVPLFADLTDENLTWLVQDFSRREFRQGDSIFHQGDPGEVMYLVESGQVRVFFLGDEGQEVTVIICGAGDIFGEMALIDDLPRSASAAALEDTVAYALSRDNFRKHMRHTAQLALNFMKALSLRVRYTSQLVGNLALLDVPSRLARKLLDLAHMHGESQPERGIRINVALTQSELANMIGTTRESINKALGHFKRQSLIRIEHGYITILKPEALEEISS